MTDDELVAAIEQHTTPLRIGDIVGARRDGAVFFEGDQPVAIETLTFPDGRVAGLDDDGRVWLTEPDPNGGPPWLLVMRHGRIVGTGRGDQLISATFEALHSSTEGL